ncbi:hypothetical protein [Lysobacter niastensis]|uniref:Uncharacterized protein n=1 Tax=Lysobacter niastensis TaxID=380629 RepID=A0ABS0BDH5_9GAMM|nr:hypothetical protein [Lysobacter niastensis]
MFFAYADSRYACFVVPYIHFALRNNPGSVVEICVDDIDVFYERSAVALQELGRVYPGRFVVRQSEVVRESDRIIPNTIRFVEPPTLEAKNIYIGDIDLLVFDNVLDVHVKYMADGALPFSNVLRQEHVASARPRLSGLHFCPFELYYPIADISDLDLSKENDEFVLYELMRRKGVMVAPSFQERPECGIHMSLSRDPLGRTTGGALATYRLGGGRWGGEQYYPTLLQQIREPDFIALYPHLELEFRLLLATLEALATDSSQLLHRTALNYMVDKRLMVSGETVVLRDAFAERDALIADSKLTEAFELGLKLCVLWSNRVDVWFKHAWLCMSTGRVTEAVAALHHLTELPGGIALLRRTTFVQTNRDRIALVGAPGRRIVDTVCSAE